MKGLDLLKRKVTILLTTILFIFFSPKLQLAESTRIFSPGVYVTLPPNQEAGPEEVITYIFQIDNYQQTPVTFKVRAVSSQGWSLLGESEQFTIEPGEKDFLVLSLLIPATALGGVEDHLDLWLSSKNTEKSFTVTTLVKSIRRLDFKAPENLRAQAGQQLFIPIQIINNGTTEEKFSLRVVSEKGSTVFWDNPDLNSISPGQKREAIINCHIPKSIPSGTLEQLVLYLSNDSLEISEHKIKVLIAEQADNFSTNDLLIPLSSDLNFSYLPPDPNWQLPWFLVWRARGDLLPQTTFNFYLTSPHYSSSSATMFMGMTGDKWALRMGSLGHNWDGLIPPPTFTSLLYLQDQRAFPWKIWLGPLTQASTPLWWGSSFNLPHFNLKLDYLNNSENESYFQHALAGKYRLLSSPLHGWELTLQEATGFGQQDIMHQEAISLARTEQEWEFLSEIKIGKDFYTLTDFKEFSVTGKSYSAMNKSLTSGFVGKTETIPGKSLCPSLKVWSSLSTGDQNLGFAYTHRFDGSINELKAGTIYRQQRNHLSLAFSFTNERLLETRKVLLLYGKYHYRFSTENYLEGIINPTIISKGQQLQLTPGLGLRWYYSLGYRWNSSGSLYWNLASEDASKLTSFQTGLKYKTSVDTSWQISTELSLIKHKPTYSMIFSLQQKDLYLLPSPWCGIHGKAFLDLNKNGEYDQGEPGIPNLPVFLNDKKIAVTKTDGSWEVPFINKGQHTISFPSEYNNYYTLQHKHELTTEINKSVRVFTPYLPPIEVKGIVFLDANGNQKYDPEESVLSGVKVLLFDQNQSLIFDTIVDNDGAFFLTLAPGEYQLAIEDEAMHKNYLKPAPINIKINRHTPPVVFFPLQPVEKEIEFFHCDNEL